MSPLTTRLREAAHGGLECRPILLLVAGKREARLEADMASVENCRPLLPPLFERLLREILLIRGSSVGLAKLEANGVAKTSVAAEKAAMIEFLIVRS